MEKLNNNALIKKGYNLKYYNKHKSKILEKAKEKKECDVCGKLCSQSNMSRHKKSKLCQSKIESY